MHRSLGVHISKVRSLLLDSWDEESVQVSSKSSVCYQITLYVGLFVSSSWSRMEMPDLMHTMKQSLEENRLTNYHDQLLLLTRMANWRCVVWLLIRCDCPSQQVR